ncbi:MAG: hypothetical protein KF833_08240 [Verrucomicrobiae bacterium]|nr:hypothetical protein [Verrucomicrobiae bacterium]
MNSTLYLLPSTTTAILAALLLFAPYPSFAQAKHELLTAAAWNALVAADYGVAIDRAGECIGEFKEAAGALQADLERAGKPLPSGGVTGAARDAILANGPLNSVATCYFIIGEASRLFVRTDPAKFVAARSAYEEAKLGFGRGYNTNGVFWIPAEKATLRLQAFATVTNSVTPASPPPR